MSEPILIALVQLFAIVAASRHKKPSDKTRLIIETYLKQYLSNKELEEYLMLFDELFSFHNLNDESFNWGSSATLEKMLQICTRINKGLQQKDKLIVFIKLVEFIEEIKHDANNINSSIEFEYYKTIKSAFNISKVEYEGICNFFLKPFDNAIDKGNYLIIKSDTEEVKTHFKTINRRYFEGQIFVHYIKSINLLIARYYGNENIYLNSHYITQNQTFIIESGSVIKNQKITPIYYADIAAELLHLKETTKLQFNVKNISFKFKNSQNGIQPFSFNAESGELIGIIGGSGTGKSTLLSLFNGSLKPNEGNIYINGHDLHDENENLKRVIGYIPQDDLLIEELTVFQNLYFNARLCFSDFSPFRLTRLILKILNDVDLTGIRDLVVGNPLKKVISGGQRKRLNIALELIREPFILFADEPTSGLSSLDSEMVVLLLKEQTLKSRLVMINIHQPSTNIFKLFDKLLFLDKGGFPIYYGNPIDSITYFKSASNYVNPTESECLTCGYINPEQLFQITESKTINKHGKVTNQRINSPDKWYQLFKSNIQDNLIKPINKTALPENSFKPPNKLIQFSIFSLRNLFIKITNKQYILINLLEAPLLALILSFLIRYSPNDNYIFGDNRNLVAYMFMSIVVALFLGMMVSAEEIIKDRKILKREAFLTLSRFSYLNSKVLFLIVLSSIQAALYVLVGNLVLGINDTLISYWIILFSISCFANLIGLNLSSGLNSVVNIYILIPFFLVPQIMLSGVIVPFDTINKSLSSNKEVPIIGDLMASRWAFEALAVNQFTNNKYSKYFYKYDKQISNYSFLTGYLIPALQSGIDECNRDISLDRNNEQTILQLKLINNEIIDLEKLSGLNKNYISNKLSLNTLNEKNRIVANNYLDSISEYFSENLRNSITERDRIYQNLSDKIGNDGVLKLKQKYYNKSLADWVLNKRSEQKLEINKSGYIRRKDPVYMKPESKFGRAHFYAPVKFIGNLEIETMWFNLFAIWLMTIVLYLTLWHDTLRKTINYFERFRLRRNSI